jgi:hypothetical protein
MKKDNVCMTVKLTQCADFELPSDSDELSRLEPSFWFWGQTQSRVLDIQKQEKATTT